MVFTCTSYSLFSLRVIDIFLLEMVPPFYNILRSYKEIPSLYSALPLYFIHRLIAPFTRLYPLLTPLTTSWNLPPPSNFPTPVEGISKLRLQHIEAGFTLWAAIVGGGLGRLGSMYCSIEPTFAIIFMGLATGVVALAKMLK